MATEAIKALSPHRSLDLGGFDRRGCSASLSNASASGITCAGYFSDVADFVTFYLFRKHDLFGHLTTTRALPASSLASVVLDFDAALTGLQSPTSFKFQSVPWGALSYIKNDGTPGTKQLQPLITSASGMTAASRVFTVNGTPAANDRCQLIFLGNVVFDVIYNGGGSGGTSSVTFSFFNSFGTGYSHFITIGANTYTHVQLATDGSGDIAIALAALINAGAGDPKASAVVSANNVILSPRLNDGSSTACSASDGNGPGTLLQVTSATAFVAASLVNQINATNWNTLSPALALIATASGANFTVYAAAYGTCNTSGTSVTWASGFNWLGASTGPICINGQLYTIASVNSPTSITLTTSAGTQTGVKYTVPGGGVDGNLIQFQELHKNSGLFITPAGASKLTGGTVESSFHLKIDFTALGIDDLQEAWLTLAPPLTYDSGTTNPAMVAFSQSNFQMVITNWTTTDPSSKLVRKIAGPGSVTVSSNDKWSKFVGSDWAQYPNSVSGLNLFIDGYGQRTNNPTDYVEVRYHCASTHDLYLGTLLYGDGGKCSVLLDGSAQTDIDTYMSTGTHIQGRVLVKASVAAGTHVVRLTLKATSNPASSGTSLWVDFIQAAVLSDVLDPAHTYPDVSSALTYDTAPGLLPPERAVWVLQRCGLLGDIDYYAGVFFALKRVRIGGSFHAATVTFGGTFTTGTGLGDGDVIWLTVGGNWPNSGTVIAGCTTKNAAPSGTGIGGTVFGIAVYPADTISTLAQRAVNLINASFVGIRAERTATAGQFIVTVLSPINGFAFDVSLSTGATGTLTITGDIGVKTGSYIIGGQEGTWATDDSQSDPLNNAFEKYLAGLSAVCSAAGISFTLAFSQELLRPRDANTSSGAWIQRYPSGTPVLTATGFGSWGTGYVEAASGSAPYTITQTGHGYISGNFVHLANSTLTATYKITLVDADHYELTTLVGGSGAYVPAAGDNAFIELQTSHCCFSPITITPYFSNFYRQAAQIMAANGVSEPWLQFGEVLHWFFPDTFSKPISSISAVVNGHFQITVTSGTTLTLTGTSGPVVVTLDSTAMFATGQNVIIAGVAAGHAGTITGGGMALYDENQKAAALTALGRPLASFWTQDDDPAINSGADVAFLQERLRVHLAAIRTAVVAVVSSAKFELLYPGDVTFASSYFSPVFPFPQGGRLNHVISLPPAYHTKTGSGLDRLMIEAQWSIGYRQWENAKVSYGYPVQSLTWNKADVHCILFWQTGGVNWEREYLYIRRLGYAAITFWAFDHLVRYVRNTQALPTPDPLLLTSG
jgi:hypothetical protein